MCVGIRSWRCEYRQNDKVINVVCGFMQGDYRGISYPKASQQYGNSSNIALLVLCSQSSLRQPRILCDVSYNGLSLTFLMLGVVTV